MFSLTVLLGYGSIIGFIVFVAILLYRLGAGDAAKGLAALSVLSVIASIAALYFF